MEPYHNSKNFYTVGHLFINVSNDYFTIKINLFVKNFYNIQKHYKYFMLSCKGYKQSYLNAKLWMLGLIKIIHDI